MPRSPGRLAAWTLTLGAAATALAEPEEALPDARAIMRVAFENRYAVDTRQVVEVRIRNAAGEEQVRRIAIATKHIDGRLYSLGRFVEPEYLRGTTLLNIENTDRSDDHFLFLRSLARIRRVSTNQRSDSFMGTDLTYQDFERRRVDDYELRSLPEARIGGEAVHVVQGRPRFDSAYERVEFFVARSDGAILETRYFKRGAERPYKVVRAPREAMRRFGEHVLPIFLEVENPARGTWTEIRIHDLAVNPELDASLFTATAIEVGRPIPGLE